jgi:hypothetical protein
MNRHCNLADKFYVKSSGEHGRQLHAYSQEQFQVLWRSLEGETGQYIERKDFLDDLVLQMEAVKGRTSHQISQKRAPIRPDLKHL